MPRRRRLLAGLLALLAGCAWPVTLVELQPPRAGAGVPVVDPQKTYYKYWVDHDERSREWILHYVDKALQRHRPGLPESPERRMALLAFDEAVHSDFEWVKRSPSLRAFYVRRLEAAVRQMEANKGKLTGGALVWQLYNHSFVVMTPSVCFAFDFGRGFWGEQGKDPETEGLTNRILDLLDALFISHEHGDHVDSFAVEGMHERRKPVIAPESVVRRLGNDREIKLLRRDGQSRHAVRLSGNRRLTVVMFPGHQDENTENNVPLVITPEGVSVVHTGDQHFENDFFWIDNVFLKHRVDILLVNNWARDARRLVRGFDPQLVIPGHESELGHDLHQRKGYFDSYRRFRGTGVPLCVMGWGESYYYTGRPTQLLDPEFPAFAKDLTRHGGDIPYYIEHIHAWALDAADQALQRHPPGSRNADLRMLALLTADHALLYSKPDANESEAIERFLKKRLEDAAHELETARVSEGMRIWKLYGRAFVCRAPGVTVAIDLNSGHAAGDLLMPAIRRIIAQCDVLLISHAESMAGAGWIKDEFLEQKKPVIADSSAFPEDKRLLRLQFPDTGRKHWEMDLAWNRKLKVALWAERVMFIEAPGGTAVVQASLNWEWIRHPRKVDVLLIDVGMPDPASMAAKFPAEVVIPFGYSPLLRAPVNRVVNYLALDRLRGIESPLMPMAWGESHHYRRSQR